MSRKIKDIKDKHTGELIYPRTHASAVVLSSNSTLSDLVDVKQDKINDLDEIRAGAALGATALQSYTEQYKGTVTGVKINGSTVSPANGTVDLGTVITRHQQLKTINGESIIGSGDITISGGGSSDANVQAVDTGDVLDDVTVDYATKTYVDNKVANIDLTSYATTSYVDNKVANINLTSYATTSYVDGLVGDINSTLGDINSVLESIINS